MPDIEEDFDAVAAIDAILNSPAEAESAPEQAAPSPAPEPEIQPQEDAPASEDGANASEVAQAPAVELTAPAVSQPKAQTAPEQPVSEATKQTQDAAAARDQNLNALTVHVHQLQAVVAGEFADIKSFDDLQALADPNSQKYNPDRYNRFVIANAKLNQAQGAQRQLQQQAMQETVRTELAKVAKQLPDFTDPVKGPALKDQLKAFAKTKGIEVENRPFLASDVLTLNSLMLAEQKIAKYESGEAAQAAKLAEASKKAAKAPQVQQPGVQRESNKDEKASTDFSRFQKSGRVDDLAAFLTNII